MAVLICTIPNDVHALAVCAAIRMLGEKCNLWYLSDFPLNQRQSIRYSDAGTTLHIANGPTDVGSYDTVWVRRPRLAEPDYEVLHPDDVSFVKMSLEFYHRGLWCAAEEIITKNNGLPLRWINPPGAIANAESKSLQLAVASRLNVPMPPTLISNDRTEVVKFISDHGGAALRKSFFPYWWLENGDAYSSEASRITVDDLPSERVVAAYPEIYQAMIDKQSELRIYAIGGRFFPFCFSPGKTNYDRVDWRGLHRQGSNVEVPWERDERILAFCSQLLTALGLSTASIEFCYDTSGEVYFLELNQAGQFIWLEHTGKPVLAATVAFLLERPECYLGEIDLSLATVSASQIYRSLEDQDRQHRSPADQFANERSPGR
jgi:hypothetical protein